MRLKRRFRARLILSIAGAVSVGAAGLSIFGYLAVERELRTSAETRALEDSELVVTQLGPARLSTTSTARELSEGGLLGDLTRTTAGYSVLFDDGGQVSSGFSFRVSPDAAVRDLVERGRFAVQWVTLDDGNPYVLVAARQQPAGPEYLLYYDARSTTEALSTLSRSLVAGSALVVFLGLAAAGLASRRILRPIERVGDAARRVAAGDLGLTVPVESDDEIGELAGSFNEMTVALAAKVAQLEQAEANQRGFVADVSHELRTPLTALVHEADLLSEAVKPLSPATERLAELLVADVDRLRRLVEDLLEISRLEAGSDQVDHEPVNLELALRAIINRHLPGAQLDVAPGLHVITDRRRLERVIANLLDNARLHGDGAEVSIAVTSPPGSAGCTISVVDYGPGVPAGREDQIFRRFAKGSSSSRHGGSGLGLAIAQGHAQRLGGTLSVRSGVEVGATFDLHLPLEPVADLLHGSAVGVTSVRQSHQ